uniref:next to BRCA1 gene 1 protein isoform X2 n=1 Tax=Myxine glutinosa TaxID=7769 RepID=UPI00358EE4CC
MDEDFVVTAFCGWHSANLLVDYTESWAEFAGRVQKVLGVRGTLRYIDDEGDEVFVDTAEEYEEALKKHVSTTGTESEEYEQLCKDVEQVQLEGEAAVKSSPSLTSQDEEGPPTWFLSYMEQFKQNLLEELSVRVLHELGKSSSGISSLNSNSINPRDTRTKTAGTFEESLLPPCDPHPRKASPAIWGLPCHHCDALIEGCLYSCRSCRDLWMCASCESNGKHNPEHPLRKFCQPSHGQDCSPTSQLVSRRLHSDTRREMHEQWRSEKRTRKAERKRQQAETRVAKRRVRQQRRLLVRSFNGSLSLAKDLEQDLDPSPTFSAASGVLPELDAEFVGENVPDGTWIQPGSQFLKLWRLRNCGAQAWTEDTKLQLLWGNLPADSSVPVPCLSRGELGAVSVTFTAPCRAGAYASHWRLAHAGKPFGPRVWCSICVEDVEDEEKQPVQCLPGQKTCSAVESVVVQENAGGAVADEGMSSTEFVCETVIRSLTLDESQEPWSSCSNGSGFSTPHDQVEDFSLSSMESTDSGTQPSDTEDFVITLPVCFDTSQPFMKAETASNSSKPGANLWLEEVGRDEAAVLSPTAAGINDLFNQKEMQDGVGLSHLEMNRDEGAMVAIDTADQTQGDAHALERTVNEEEASGLLADYELQDQGYQRLELADDILDKTTHRPFNLEDAASSEVKTTTVSNTIYTNTVNNQPSPLQLQTSYNSRHLVNDALTCASAALRSIFKPQAQPQIETGQALLLEMGFGDRALNSQLLRRHGGDLPATVADLLQLTDAHWYHHR